MLGIRLEYPIKTLAFFTPVSHSFAQSERAEETHKDLGTNHKFKMAGEGIFQGMAVFLNVSAVYQRYVEMYCK